MRVKGLRDGLSPIGYADKKNLPGQNFPGQAFKIREPCRDKRAAEKIKSTNRFSPCTCFIYKIKALLTKRRQNTTL